MNGQKEMAQTTKHQSQCHQVMVKGCGDLNLWKLQHTYPLIVVINHTRYEKPSENSENSPDKIFKVKVTRSMLKVMLTINPEKAHIPLAKLDPSVKSWNTAWVQIVFRGGVIANRVICEFKSETRDHLKNVKSFIYFAVATVHFVYVLCNYCSFQNMLAQELLSLGIRWPSRWWWTDAWFLFAILLLTIWWVVTFARTVGSIYYHVGLLSNCGGGTSFDWCHL